MADKREKKAAKDEKPSPEQTFRMLLDELHAKRRWLDAMIASIEAALDSPERRLVEATKKALVENPNVPIVDLAPDQQATLADLAERVRVGARKHDG